MKLTVLVDNYVNRPLLMAEHGLAVYLETDNVRVLFDTGQSGCVVHNARQLGLRLEALDAIVLSHGHYDHSGGLPAVAEVAPAPHLYGKPGITGSKYSLRDGAYVDIGMPPESVRALSAMNFRPVQENTEILPGIAVLAQIPVPREHRFDTHFGVPDGRGFAADTFEDELALAIDEPSGLTVITGCSHRGILNILATACATFPGKPLKAVVGGFHLGGCDEKTVREIAKAIGNFSPRIVCCCHCTGLDAFAVMKSTREFPIRWIGVGESV